MTRHQRLSSLKQTISKLITALRYFCAVLCAVAFVISLAAALLLVNAENQLFKSETYKQALQTTDIYARLPALISQQLASGTAGANGKELPGYLQILTAKDWEGLVRSVLPPDLLKQVSEQTLDAVFDYFDGKTSSAAISLVPLKQRLSQKSMDVAQQILSVQPHCTVAQLANLLLGSLAGQQPGDEVLCNPPAELTDTFLPLIDPAVQAAIATIPDRYPLLDKNHQPRLLPELEHARLEMRLSPLVALAFLVLMSLLAVRSSAGWLRWWGIPLASAGGLGLLAGSLYEPITRAILLVQAPNLIGMLGAAAGPVQDIILAVARDVAIPVLIQSVVIVGIGVGMTVLAKDWGKEQPAA